MDTGTVGAGDDLIMTLLAQSMLWFQASALVRQERHSSFQHSSLEAFDLALAETEQ